MELILLYPSVFNLQNTVVQCSVSPGKTVCCGRVFLPWSDFFNWIVWGSCHKILYTPLPVSSPIISLHSFFLCPHTVWIWLSLSLSLCLSQLMLLCRGNEWLLKPTEILTSLCPVKLLTHGTDIVALYYLPPNLKFSVSQLLLGHSCSCSCSISARPSSPHGVYTLLCMNEWEFQRDLKKKIEKINNDNVHASRNTKSFCTFWFLLIYLNHFLSHFNPV